MKLKRYSAFILAGVLACSTPVCVFADSSVNAMAELAKEVIEGNQLDSLIEDPDKVTDIILYVKEQIGQTEVTDEELQRAIDLAEETFGIDLSDEEEQSLIKIIKEVKDMDIDEDKLREQVNSVYSGLEKLGVDKDDVKGFLSKAIDFITDLIE